MKTCCRCKELKPLDEFYPRKHVKDGKMYHCKVCQDKITTNSRRVREFGIDQKTYDEMLKKCKEKCQICGNKRAKQLAIDHDHKTGKIRGLLCGNCNLGLGYFNDSIELLKNSIKYLKKSNNI